jgi:Methyl-accepting chemotaxis protein (MCP) signalling domain
LLFQQRTQLVFAVDLSFLRRLGCLIEPDLAAVIRVGEVTLRIDFAGRICGIGRAAAFLVAALLVAMLLVLTLLRGVLQPAKGPHRSGATLRGIVDSVKRVTDIVGDIAVASSEQSTGVEQVNSAITQMDHVTQSNSAQAEQLSATAQTFAHQAMHLMQLVGRFKLEHADEQAHGDLGHQPLPGSSRRIPGTQAGPARTRPSALADKPAGRAANKPTRLTESPVLIGSAASRSDETSFGEF